MGSLGAVRRSTTDAKVAGLCGGVAAHWGIDPVLVRVGCVLLALSGGIGVVLYLAGWLLIPAEGRSSAALDDLLGEPARRWPRRLRLAVVAVACLLVLGAVESLSPFGIGPALILAGLWYFGYHKNRPQRGTGSHPEPHPPPPPAPAAPPAPPTSAGLLIQPDPDPAPDQRAAFFAVPDPVGLYAPTAPTLAAASRPAPRRVALAARRLRLVWLIGLGAVLAGLSIADAAGVPVPLAAYAATALLVTGLALVAAAWWGRARGILPVGVALLLAVILTSAEGPVARLDDWGTERVGYARLAELPADGDSRHMGRLVVDLSQLTVDRDATYAAHVDVGSLEVTVPADTAVRISYRVDSGAVFAFDQAARGGSDLQGTIDPVGGTGSPVLTLNLSVDRGKVWVR